MINIKNKIKINVKGCKTKPISDFKSFQGNLKTLSKEAQKKLEQSIIRNGFNAPIFVWAENDYILDGHQRINAIQSLIKQGYTLEDNQLPYIEIEAETKKQAAEMVLSYNSQYGEITSDGMLSFLEEFNLEIPELESFTNINLDFEKLNEIILEKEITEDDLKSKSKCPKCGFEW